MVWSFNSVIPGNYQEEGEVSYEAYQYRCLGLRYVHPGPSICYRYNQGGHTSIHTGTVLWIEIDRSW